MPLTNAQYDEIMRSYQERQLKRQRLIASREQEIAEKAPRMAELNAEIARLCVREARQRLRGGADMDPDGSGPSPLNNRDIGSMIAELTAGKHELLASMGYPEDYLDPPYRCPDCRDTGYIGSERCHCFRQAAIDLVYGQSHLSPVFDRDRFDRFRLDYYPKDLIDKGTGISSYDSAGFVLRRCMKFVQDFDSSYENLFLFGDVGVGKTFLCNCIAGELIRSGHSVVYFTSDRLFRTLADLALGREVPSKEDYNVIFDCDLLIIDDLGTELPNALTLSQFFVCLNDRILQERSTVISSNLGLQKLSETYSERIFSRITSCYQLLHLFGRDIRVLKNV